DREAGSTDLDDAFRRAHSLKGAARAVDLRGIEHLAHRLETLFARIRTGAVTLDKPVIKVIHEALDSSEDWLAAMTKGDQPADPVRALSAIDVLLGTNGDGQAAAKPAPDVVKAQPSSRAEPAKTPAAPSAPVAAVPIAPIETVRLNADSLDRIVNSSGQL